MTKKDGDRLREYVEELEVMAYTYGPGSTTRTGMFAIQDAIRLVLQGLVPRVNVFLAKPGERTREVM